MSEILNGVTLLLATGSICFGCFVWGTVKHFEWQGRGARGAWLVSAMSWVAFLAFASEVVRRGLTAWWPAGLALFLVSLWLWAWALSTTRRRPPTLAFTDDRPQVLFHDGPYRWVRHPFYTAYMCFWVGGLVADGAPASAVCVVVIGTTYAAAAIHEERKFASSTLAGRYRDYASQTGRFVPRIRRRGDWAP
jgi:protein-S-isoprenylcysteine O-methyltransferase Ste14